MAKLNIISSFIAILIISSAIPSFCKSQNDKTKQEEDANDKYIKSLPKELVEYVRNCTKNLSSTCGLQILNATIIGIKANIEKECCNDLIGIGLKCYTSFIKVYVGLPKVKGKIDAKVFKKNVGIVFNKCVGHDKEKKNQGG